MAETEIEVRNEPTVDEMLAALNTAKPETAVYLDGRPQAKQAGGTVSLWSRKEEIEKRLAELEAQVGEISLPTAWRPIEERLELGRLKFRELETRLDALEAAVNHPDSGLALLARDHDALLEGVRRTLVLEEKVAALESKLSNVEESLGEFPHEAGPPESAPSRKVTPARLQKWAEDFPVVDECFDPDYDRLANRINEFLHEAGPPEEVPDYVIPK